MTKKETQSRFMWIEVFKIKKIITITDVAREAGVSTAAACNALSGKGRMRDETRNRVIEVAKKLDYHPNRAASALARKTVVIGVLLPAFPEVVQRQLYNGICDRFKIYREQNFEYRLCYHSLSDNATEQRRFLEENYDKIDGLIIEGGHRYQAVADYYDKINARGIPVVSLITCDGNLRISTSVTVNARITGHIAAQIFKMQSRKKAVLLTGVRESPIHRHNIEGFCEAIAKTDIELLGIYDIFDDMELTYNTTSEIIHSGNGVDSIFVTSYVAPSVCRCLKDMGIDKKVTVVGVDIYDETVECLMDESLNVTIFQNQYQSAVKAVDTMVGYFTYDANRKTNELLIKPEIVMKSNLSCYIKKNS